MDDEIRHRHENDKTGRNVAIVACATVVFSALWEYLDPTETTKYLFLGFVAGVTVGFLLCYFTSQKR